METPKPDRLEPKMNLSNAVRNLYLKEMKSGFLMELLSVGLRREASAFKPLLITLIGRTSFFHK